MEIPVVTIDGPSGSGKGTIAQLLADDLGWHLLDSGALYRVLAYAAQQQGISIEAESAELVSLAEALPVSFSTIDGATHAMLDGQSVEAHIRTETAGNAASKVAAMLAVREALLKRQHDFVESPGLVADGRDMGTTVFPHAPAKIFLTASVEERAQRRHKQLKQKGIDANFRALSEEIAERDARDASRAASPLRPADDALLLDSSGITIEQVLQKARDFLAEREVI
ncbi:MAG: (d)CMP kinase [Gammaproteobacteria bacterium]|nr:(d)CMP kinase [Gammaproteobacteria bacterium]